MCAFQNNQGHSNPMDKKTMPELAGFRAQGELSSSSIWFSFCQGIFTSRWGDKSPIAAIAKLISTERGGREPERKGTSVKNCSLWITRTKTLVVGYRSFHNVGRVCFWKPHTTTYFNFSLCFRDSKPSLLASVLPDPSLPFAWKPTETKVVANVKIEH